MLYKEQGDRIDFLLWIKHILLPSYSPSIQWPPTLFPPPPSSNLAPFSSVFAHRHSLSRHQHPLRRLAGRVTPPSSRVHCALGVRELKSHVLSSFFEVCSKSKDKKKHTGFTQLPKRSDAEFSIGLHKTPLVNLWTEPRRLSLCDSSPPPHRTKCRSSTQPAATAWCLSLVLQQSLTQTDTQKIECSHIGDVPKGNHKFLCIPTCWAWVSQCIRLQEGDRTGCRDAPVSVLVSNSIYFCCWF